MNTHIFLFGREFEAEILPRAHSWDDVPCRGWLDKDFGFFNESRIKFFIQREEKDLSLSFLGRKSFFMTTPFFSLRNKNDDPFSKYKLGLFEAYGRPRKTGFINDSFEDWPDKLASSFLTTAIETLSNIEGQALYGRLEKGNYEKMSFLAYENCRNLDWSNPKIQRSGAERILELIVKASIEECALAFVKNGNFEYASGFKTKGFDAVALGAYILATGKLPDGPLEKLNYLREKEFIGERY